MKNQTKLTALQLSSMIALVMTFGFVALIPIELLNAPTVIIFYTVTCLLLIVLILSSKFSDFLVEHEDTLEDNVMAIIQEPEPTSNNFLGFKVRKHQEVNVHRIPETIHFNKDFVQELPPHAHDWVEYNLPFLRSLVSQCSVNLREDPLNDGLYPVLVIGITQLDNFKTLYALGSNTNIYSKISDEQWHFHLGGPHKSIYLENGQLHEGPSKLRSEAIPLKNLTHWGIILLGSSVNTK